MQNQFNLSLAYWYLFGKERSRVGAMCHLIEAVQGNTPVPAFQPTLTGWLFCPLPVSALAQIQGSSAAAPATGLPQPCSLHTAPVKACSSFLHVLSPQQRVPELPIKPPFSPVIQHRCPCPEPEEGACKLCGPASSMRVSILNFADVCK